MLSRLRTYLAGWTRRPPSLSSSASAAAPDAGLPAGRQARLEAVAALRAAGHFDAALDRLTELLAEAPHCPQTHHRLAALHLNRGEPARALAHLRAVISRYPKNPRFRLQLADALEQAGRPLEAIDALLAARASCGPDAADELDDALRTLLCRRDLDLPALLAAAGSGGAGRLLDADALRALGQASLALNRRRDAVAAFEASLVMDPSSAATLLALAAVADRFGEPARARALLEQAVAVDPGAVEACIELGAAALRASRPAAALAACERALALAPDSPRAQLYKAAALRGLGRFADAHTWFDAAWGRGAASGNACTEQVHLGLRIATLARALLLPFAPGSTIEQLKGGIAADPPGPVYLQHLRACGRRPRVRTDPAAVLADGAPDATSLPGCHLYAGPFFEHFGHFATECIHRLWGADAGEPFDQVLVLAHRQDRRRPAPRRFEELLPFQRQALAFFGFPAERVALITRPTRVERLLVPEQASMLSSDLYPPDTYLDWLGENAERFFAHHAPALGQYPEKLFIGRSHLLHMGGLAGEGYLQQLLAMHGFHIFRPEAHPLCEQLNHLRHARIIVFAEGSAIHALEFLGRLDAAPIVVVLGRRGRQMGAWRRVVKPRVGAFHFFAGVTALPALGYNAALDSSMTGAVLSMVHAPEELFAFLGQHLDLPRSLFDEDAFHQREAADVARYLLHASLDSADSGRFRAALERFRKRLRAVTGNPYLRPA